MNRFLLLLAALAATLAIACGGDKKDDDRSDERPAATATSAADEPSGDADSDDRDEAPNDDELSDDEAGADDDSSSSGANPAGFFSPLLGLGLGGATGGGPATLPGVQQGSGDLEQYLPGADDVPAGYESMGTFSMKMPADAAQDFPGGEIAMSMWANGDFQGSDVPDGSMLMIAVMRPDDPSAVDEFSGGCDGFDEDALTEGFGNGDAGFLGIEFKDIETLDSSGLGDSACGIGLTMDMSGFFEGLQEGFGDDLGDEVPDEVIDALSAFKMRMRVFGEGDKVGMVMQIGFGADADLVDDLSLAQELRGNLQ